MLNPSLVWRHPYVISIKEEDVLDFFWKWVPTGHLAPLFDYIARQRLSDLIPDAVLVTVRAKLREARERKGLVFGSRGKPVRRKAKKRRDHFARGEPMVKYIVVPMFQVDRIVALMEATVAKTHVGVFKPRDWQTTLPLRVFRQVVAVFLHFAQPIARAMIQATENNETHAISQAVFYIKRAGESGNAGIARRGNAASELSRDGVYFGIVIKDGVVVGIYWGRTIILFRFVDHLGYIVFGGHSAQFYEAARKGQWGLLFTSFVRRWRLWSRR